jgi:hypothetical protein
MLGYVCNPLAIGEYLTPVIERLEIVGTTAHAQRSDPYAARLYCALLIFQTTSITSGGEL